MEYFEDAVHGSGMTDMDIGSIEILAGFVLICKEHANITMPAELLIEPVKGFTPAHIRVHNHYCTFT